MLTIPFDKKTFSTDCKTMLSGANITLDFDNIQSTMAKVAVDLSKILGKDLYEAICSKTAVVLPSDPTEEQEHTKEYLDKDMLDDLKRAMLHFSVYHHVIYFIARISNDGITVRKDDNMTTIYRYQQQELQDQLLNDAWFWVDRMLEQITDFAELIPLFEASKALPVTTLDFQHYVGISSPSFVAHSRWITTEVIDDLIGSLGSTTVTPAMKCAVVYEVVSRACVRMPYHMLPEPLRVMADNEQTKEVDRTTYIRTTIADVYHQRSESQMERVRIEEQKRVASDVNATASAQPYKATQRRDDKFCSSL